MLSLLFALAHAEPLTYEAALQAALAQNPTLQMAVQDQKAADGRLLSARATFRPTLTANAGTSGSLSESLFFGTAPSVSGSNRWDAGFGLSQYAATGTAVGLNFSTDYSRSEEVTYTFESIDFVIPSQSWYNSYLNVSLTQSLLQGFRTAYNLQGVHAAEASAQITEANARASRQQVLAEVSRAYWDLYYQQQLKVISQQGLELALEQERVVKALVADGRLASVEATRIGAAVAQARRALLTADAGALAAADQLRTLMGQTPGTPIEVASTPVMPPDLSLDEEQVIQAVLAGSPELAALKIAEQNAALATRQARHGLLPELSATATYALQGYENSFSSSLSEMFGGALPQWTLGANLSVPLGNAADRGSYQAQAAEAEKASLQVASTTNSLRQAARAQVRALQTARLSVELAGQNLQLAEETLRAEQARFGEGRTLQQDLIQSARDRDTARVEYQRALTDYQLALVELMRLQGTL